MASTRAALCKSNSRLSKFKGVAEAVDTDMKSIALTIGQIEVLYSKPNN
jgi:hypothetical protein